MSTKKKAAVADEPSKPAEASAPPEAEPSEPAEASAPPAEYDPARLITPQEACSYFPPTD